MAGFLKRTFFAFFGYCVRFTQFWTHIFFFLRYWGHKRQVPPATDPLLLRSATSLADGIRHGKVRSEAVVKAYMRRIQEVDPYINATVDRRFVEAVAEAQAVDALVASGATGVEDLARLKPLLGVPFTVKSLIGVKGLGCTAGSMQFSEVRAASDAEVVRLLREAGAICLATTNTAEMGMGFETCNLINGRTRNPYDTTKTSGGSSGGEGALVGAAGSVIGIGNDLAGSIRLPCHYNGLFGHKPTRGAVSNLGVFPVPHPKIHDYLSTGPMCRYSEDLITAMRILNSGTDVPMKFGSAVDFSKVKIYFKERLDGIPAIPKLNSEYSRLFKQAVDHFRNTYGSDVKELPGPNLRKTASIVIHSTVSGNPNVVKTLTGGKNDVHAGREFLKYFIGKSRFSFGPLVVMNTKKLPMYNDSRVEHYEKLKQTMDHEFQMLLDDDSVLLMPTFSQAAPYHDQTLLLLWSTNYTALFNVLGMPVTQCPLGYDRKGMPLGIQVIGRRGNDALTMAFAVELEKAFGGWRLPGAMQRNGVDVSRRDDVKVV